MKSDEIGSENLFFFTRISLCFPVAFWVPWSSGAFSRLCMRSFSLFLNSRAELRPLPLNTPLQHSRIEIFQTELLSLCFFSCFLLLFLSFLLFSSSLFSCSLPLFFFIPLFPFLLSFLLFVVRRFRSCGWWVWEGREGRIHGSTGSNGRCRGAKVGSWQGSLPSPKILVDWFKLKRFRKKIAPCSFFIFLF